MLEQNWASPAASNPQVEATLAHWQAVEKRATPYALGSWRFQQGLIRAYADAFVQQRVQYEAQLIDEVYRALKKAQETGVDAALTRAEEILSKADPTTEAPELRARVHELAGMLFASIGMQLSMEKYGASAHDRGAQLDNNDAPLTDCAWLRLHVPAIRQLPTEREQLAAIDKVVNWTNPGPGGFYDDLGNRANGRDPHLVRDITWEEDPSFLRGVQDSHYGPWFPERGRLSWAYQAHVYLPPLRMRYTGLDGRAGYVYRVTIAGRGAMTLQLHLGGQPVGKPLAFDGREPVVHEFNVPESAIVNGSLDVAWDNVEGHDVQIAEAWLIRKR
jgi:hypothetical protein